METVTTDGEPPDLTELLALVGPAGEASLWTCDDLEALGPSAAELRLEASAGPIPGRRLAELAADVDILSDGTFEATRPDDDRPWLAVRVIGANQFAIATRSRRLLDELRSRFA